MMDGYGRTIDYMRISITDRCNLRCRYCMPEGISRVLMEEILTLEEIVQIAACAAELGIRHLKITGGEPLVRKGCVELIAMLKKATGIETVTLTTNGILLNENLDGLLKAGVDGINISLDTLERERYRELTGADALNQVLFAVEAAARTPVSIKINCVSMKSRQQREEWIAVAELAKRYCVDVRFIEMMPIGHGKDFGFVSHEQVLGVLRARYPEMVPDERKHGFGPAVYYRIPGFRGSIGFISAVHEKFCDSCNRIRLTAGGRIKMCLCYDRGVDLMPLLRGVVQDRMDNSQKIKQVIRQAILEKPQAHCFERPEQVTEKGEMSRIGG